MNRPRKQTLNCPVRVTAADSLGANSPMMRWQHPYSADPNVHRTKENGPSTSADRSVAVRRLSNSTTGRELLTEGGLLIEAEMPVHPAPTRGEQPEAFFVVVLGPSVCELTKLAVDLLPVAVGRCFDHLDLVVCGWEIGRLGSSPPAPAGCDGLRRAESVPPRGYDR